MGFSSTKAPLRIGALISVWTALSCTDAVSPSKPTKLAFVVEPPSSVVAGTPITPGISVAIQDENGNTVTDATDEITISFASNPADGRLAGALTRHAVAGVATFSDLFIKKAGTGYTFAAAAPHLDGAVSTQLEVKAGAAQTLSFVIQPSTSVAGTPLPAISVAVKDASDNTVPSATNRITVTLQSNSSGATLVGNSVSADAVSGVATFSDVSILKAGSNYQLFAFSSGLGQVNSIAFNIVAGPPTKLAFTTQPEGALIGDVLNAIVVEAQDAAGNRTTNATSILTIALGANTSGAALSGTTTLQTVGGAVIFNDLRIDKPGASYTLVASNPTLQPATTAPFNIRTALLATSLSAGYFHSCAVEVGGAAYCWGDNGSGQLGSSTSQTRTTPAAVSGGIAFAKIGAGRNHTCGLTSSGVLYCWGANNFGQLGNSATSTTLSPVAGGLAFADFSNGYDHTCAVSVEGAGYCWGSGSGGELGNDVFGASPVPVPVSGGLVFASIGAGRSFTCGVTTSGAGYCWGVNDTGELGNGTQSPSGKPTAISGSLKFAAVSAGGFHSCGLTTSGAAYCWGQNAFGQLGNGTNTGSTVPVAVSGDRVFVMLSVGNRHNCAVTATGDAYCWGDNSSLNLGNGGSANSTVPALVAGGHRFASVTAGRFHSCGVTTEREVYCWGAAGAALGTGTTASSPVPVRVR